MQVSIWASILFVLGFCVLFGGIFLYPKAEETISGVKWLGLTLVAALCFHTLMAGIINLIHIPVNIVSIGILDLAAGGVLLYLVWKKKAAQKYMWKMMDLTFFALLILAATAFARLHYSSELYINYFSVDPSAHFRNALNVIKEQSVYGMFYAPLNNGLFMEVLAPAVKFSSYYKLFVLADVLHLGLGGLIFYGAIRSYCKDRFTNIAAVLLPFLYLVGYQSNSTIFGFVYLGMGVTIVAYLISVVDLFLKESKPGWFHFALVSLGCFGIFQCYVLFMPVVFVSILLATLIKQKKKKQLISKETVIWGLVIFLIPCILGLYYIFSGIFTNGTTVNGAIAVEGGIYKDLYSNFIPYIPFAVYGLYASLKNKENHLVRCLFPLWGAFMAGLLLLGLYGKVSSYYYFKTYYVMWLLVLWMGFYGVVHISQKERVLVVIYAAMQLAIMGNYVFKIEDRITAKNEMFNSSPKNVVYNDLLSFQCQVLRWPVYSPDKLELYQYVYDELLEPKQADMVACAADTTDYLWYHAITYQDYTGSDYWNMGAEAYMDNLYKNQNYVLVLYDSPLYNQCQREFQQMPVMYANNAGFVAQVENDGNGGNDGKRGNGGRHE